MAIFVCSKCGRQHLAEEVKENHFCRNCGRFLMHEERKYTVVEDKVKPQNNSSEMGKDSVSLFPYDPYPQQLEFMRDIQRVLGEGKVLVAEACNGFGKTISALSSVLSFGKKVIYATRTHEQVRQVLHEVAQINKRAGIDFSAVALASRQNLCLNETCKRLSTIDAVETCRILRQKHECPYKAEPSRLLYVPKVLSTRLLLRYGKTNGVCPYFLSRKVAENCDVVVAPYQYIFNGVVKTMVKLNINGKVLIFDEAHNSDKIGQDVLSDTLSDRGLSNAKKELELTGVPSSFIDDLKDYLISNIQGEPVLKKGSELLHDLKRVLREDLTFFIEAYAPVIDEIRDYRLSHGEAPICYLNGVLNFLSLVDSSDKESYVAIYRRAFSGLNIIEYRCLDPSLAIKPVIKEAHAALIMSGTLSPMNLFTEVLGLSDAETRTYSAIAKPENIRTFVDTSVTTRFKERSTEMLRHYGEDVVQLMKKVTHGALIFFPQRMLMKEALENWQKNGLITRKGKKLFINEKRVFIEGERASDNTKIVDKYKKTAKGNEGAVLFAVFRGRNAEGSNFPYDEARGIFNIGVPFADYHDPIVRAQIEFFNKKILRLGDTWYIMDAFRTANQALGRGIRHRDDWCHFYLMDKRYATHRSFISKWAVLNGIEEIKAS